MSPTKGEYKQTDEAAGYSDTSEDLSPHVDFAESPS